MPAETRLTCDDVADTLAAAADGIIVADAATQSHVDQCLRCQADVVQYRKLLRSLRAMRTQLLEPAPGMLTDVLASVEEAAERHAIRSVLTGRNVAYFGGIAAATAAGAAGALVIATRSRRLRPAS